MRVFDDTHHGSEVAASDGRGTGEVALACAGDDGYAMPLAVMLRSLGDHLGDGRSAVVHVLDCGIGGPNRQQLLRSLDGLPLSLVWHRPELDRIRAARPGEEFAVSTYARLLMPELIDAPHVVYLDGDVLVLDDVGVLYDLPIAPYAALAVTDPTGAGRLADCDHLPAGVRAAAVDGAPGDARYANTGVMPIDLDEARRSGFTERALGLLAELPERPKWVDQDLICVTLAGRIGPLPARWNAYANVFTDRYGPSHLPDDELAEARSSPAIVHYTLDSKPWRRKCPHPMQAQWFEAVDRTAWRGFRPNYRNQPPDWRARLARMRRHR